jgi:hypothetical protein
MRRILFVLTVAALMAAMMVIGAGSAQANNLNFGNSSNVVLFGNSLVGFGDIGDFDGIVCCHHGNDFGDFDGIGCCHLGNDFGDNDNEISVNFGGFSIESD